MSSFAVAFDIDGVILRGRELLPRAEEAVHRLQANNVPFVFVTNGGGDHESARAEKLQNMLGVSLEGDKHVVLAHTPMKELVQKHKHERVLILGCRNEMEVARRYGFDKVVSPQHFAAQHKFLYPFRPPDHFDTNPNADEPIGAILIMHDPIDWHLELQVCTDVLLNQVPGLDHRQQDIPIYNSNEDFIFAGAYEFPRYAQGAFLSCLQALYREHGGGDLDIIRYGKPNKVTYDFAESLLRTQVTDSHSGFEKIFMIGDNPLADIRGASTAGHPWYGILVNTGIYSTTLDMEHHDPHHICHGVGEAVDHIFDIMSNGKQ